MQNKIHNAWHPIASYQICKKQEKMTQTRRKKKNQSTGSEVMMTTESLDKVTRTAL